MAVVANGQVQVAVTVIVTPGDAARIGDIGRSPDQGKGVVMVVAIDLVRLAIVAHGKVEVAVVVEIAPGEAAAVEAACG